LKHLQGIQLKGLLMEQQFIENHGKAILDIGLEIVPLA